MNDFQIDFLYNKQSYRAHVKQTGNLYYVTPQHTDLEQEFGEVMLLEANGDFAWSNQSPEHYRYVLCIANALKKQLGFAE